MSFLGGGSAIKKLPAVQETWRCRFYLWVGKIPWRRKWQPTQVILTGKISWTEEPGWATVHGVTKELELTEQLNNNKVNMLNNRKD